MDKAFTDDIVYHRAIQNTEMVWRGNNTKCFWKRGYENCFFFYLGEPARLWRHLTREAVETFHETSLLPDQVPDRRRAVGLSVPMSGRHRPRNSLVSPPFRGARGDSETSKPPSISTSIPLARPSGTSSRFAAKHPLPAPAPFPRAANPTHGPSLGNGIRPRIRPQICNR